MSTRLITFAIKVNIKKNKYRDIVRWVAEKFQNVNRPKFASNQITTRSPSTEFSDFFIYFIDTSTILDDNIDHIH